MSVASQPKWLTQLPDPLARPRLPLKQSNRLFRKTVILTESHTVCQIGEIS